MDKNTKVLFSILLIAALMVGLAFASVPLYNMFCRVTGYGGTTQRSNAAPSESEIKDRVMTIHFNTTVSTNLDWTFKPEKRNLDVKVGQQGFISFKAKSHESKTSAGTAIFNVTPQKAGIYFQKTQCFCFDKQSLNPGQEADMPVVFYIDPSIMDDQNMDDVNTITLSYSFFLADSKELDTAIEEFYNAP